MLEAKSWLLSDCSCSIYSMSGTGADHLSFAISFCPNNYSMEKCHCIIVEETEAQRL